MIPTGIMSHSSLRLLRSPSVCLLVNLCIVWLAVELFSLNYLTGKIIATLFAFVWNYHGQKRYTFSGGR